jgi:alpha-glucan,water dikinase
MSDHHAFSIRVPLFEKVYPLNGFFGEEERRSGVVPKEIDSVGLFATVYVTQESDRRVGSDGSETATDGVHGDSSVSGDQVKDWRQARIVCRFLLVLLSRDEVQQLDQLGASVPRALKERLATRETFDWSLLLQNSPVYLHWGVALEHPDEWSLPPARALPPGTIRFDSIAVRTEFPASNPKIRIHIPFEEIEGSLHTVRGIKAVIYRAKDRKFFKDGRADFFVPVWDSVRTWIVGQIGDEEPIQDLSLTESAFRAAMGVSRSDSYMSFSREASPAPDSLGSARSAVRRSISLSSVRRMKSSSSLDRIVKAGGPRDRSLKALRKLHTGSTVSFEQLFRGVGRGGAGSLDVVVEEITPQEEYHVHMTTDIRGLALHWGVSRKKPGQWLLARRDWWPPGISSQADHMAVRSEFQLDEDNPGVWRLDLCFKRELSTEESSFETWLPSALVFVLYQPEYNFWSNHNNDNFVVPVAPPAPSSIEDLYESYLQKLEEQEKQLSSDMPMSGSETESATSLPPAGTILGLERRSLDDDGEAVICFCVDETGFVLRIHTDLSPLIVHWGVARHRMTEFLQPDEHLVFEATGRTYRFEDKAVRTEFVPDPQHKGAYYAELHFKKENAPRALTFVLFNPELNRWYSAEGGGNFVLRMDLDSFSDLPGSVGKYEDIGQKIIEVEVEYGSWTLMHRYNLANDIIQSSISRLDADLLQIIFVWLRYSFLRQLDWQRAYNTQPRLLAHAQEQLTRTFAQVYANRSDLRFWVRLCLSTLGRGGGNGQRIRDDILRIMHKHHIPETPGHFMEQWHQKLHNNTTPDDVAICESYLEFLKSNGDQNVFYETLQKHGVTRERLASYERPIRAEVQMYSCDNNALIHDLEEYLHILKSVHSGTDLAVVLDYARWTLDGELIARVERIQSERAKGMADPESALNISFQIAETRKMLQSTLGSVQEADRIRDMLFLDLALEELARLAVESQGLAEYVIQKDLRTACNLLIVLAEHVGWSMLSDAFLETSYDIGALVYGCNTEAELAGPDFGLRLYATMERLMDCVGHGVIELLHTQVQPKAVYIGTGCNVDEKMVTLFSEELIRGQAAFALTQVLRPLMKNIRKQANLGNWQIISPGECSGHGEVFEELMSIQYKTFDRPTVAFVRRISGEEEIPTGMVGLITTDTLDILSHCAVRARNERVVLACCYSEELFEQLARQFQGVTVTARSLADGSLEFQAAGEKSAQPTDSGKGKGQETASRRPVSMRSDIVTKPSKQVLGIAEITSKHGGSKSNSLAKLVQIVPDWIHIPPCALIPFGTCEQVLEEPQNVGILETYRQLMQELDSKGPEDDCSASLARLRHCVRQLRRSDNFASELKNVLEREGFRGSAELDMDRAWECILDVWASKFNDRAFLALRKAGAVSKSSLSSLYMAVLVQEVVPADYAFVLHTKNPFTSEESEIYGELVHGLGEVLVGNYPGRALGFTYAKASGEIRVCNYPSKIKALLPQGGLIFRSDSNGEDLEDFAGAGLFDSILMRSPQEIVIRYRELRIMQDKSYLHRLLQQIGKSGTEIERNCSGKHQDIEGCVSGEDIYIVQSRDQV